MTMICLGAPPFIQGYNMQVKKIILLLKNAGYVPKNPEGKRKFK